MQYGILFTSLTFISQNGCQFQNSYSQIIIGVGPFMLVMGGGRKRTDCCLIVCSTTINVFDFQLIRGTFILKKKGYIRKIFYCSLACSSYFDVSHF